MEYLTLNNGVRMPMLGYGTWDVRGAAGRRCIREALEVGYRLLDTARMYENEDIVGQAVRESGLPREDVFITTKLYRPSAGYEKARRDIEGSLRALGTDYIDLLLIHEPYEEAPAMYRALEEACRAGKVRAVGVSNFNWDEYQRLAGACEMIPAVDQVESHVYFPGWSCGRSWRPGAPGCSPGRPLPRGGGIFLPSRRCRRSARPMARRRPRPRCGI